MDKLVKDGLVAVLYSPGFGAGWSTWNREYPEMVFDPGLAELLDQGRRGEAFTYATLKWPDAFFGGFDNLEIWWLPQGEMFRIVEQDGNEEIELRSRNDWSVA